MMRNILLIGMSMLFIACANQRQESAESEEKKGAEYTPLVIEPEEVTSIKMDDSISEQLLIRGREIAVKAKLALKEELRNAIKENGLEYAISFCSDRAIEITDSIGIEEQVMIKRLARKNRNPLNAMDENESKLFKSFVVQKLTSNWVPAQVGWDTEGRPVYYNPIVTEALCLNCHGKIGENINPDVASKIAEIYPDDKAVDFEVGHFRGMWAITFPEYKVTGVETGKSQLN